MPLIALSQILQSIGNDPFPLPSVYEVSESLSTRYVPQLTQRNPLSDMLQQCNEVCRMLERGRRDGMPAEDLAGNTSGCCQ